MHRMILPFLVVLTIVAVTWWKATSTPAAAGPAAIADSAPLQQPADAMPGPRRSQALPVDDVAVDVEAMRRQQRSDADKVVAAGRSKLVGRYDGEGVDHAWATAKQSELMAFRTSQQIEAIGAQADNLAINCRTSVCRIDADFSSRSEAEDWTTLYLTGAGSRIPNASTRVVPNTDGTFHLEIYGLARN